MNCKQNKLRDAVLIALAVGTAGTTGVAFADESKSGATTLDRLEVTGSRIKRAQIEGASPVFSIDRQQLDASGDVSVADYLRDTTFNSFGSYQSTSGSSWGGFSGISMRGLGEGRTLILVDGRRAPSSPMTGGAQDLNSIPMAAVERIEILTDGASAIYGSDAIGGVVNIITRKIYEGVEVSYGLGRPTNPGGDTEEMSILMGAAGEKSRVMIGASHSKRDVIFTRDRDYWYSPDMPGASSYSNNFSTLILDPLTGKYNPPSSLGTAGRLRHPSFGAAVPGLCTNGDDSDLFWMSGTTAANLTCQFNHSATSANLTSTGNTSVFGRGDYQINDDWSLYFNSSVVKAESFGRYASLPSSPWPGGAIVLKAGSPNHPGTAPSAGGLNPNYDAYYAQFANQDLALYHRFAALGTRDNHTENVVMNFNGGVEGRIGNVDVEFGSRYVKARALNTGEGYVVGGLAQVQIDKGAYNIYNPFSGNPQSLGMTTRTSRDMYTEIKEFYGSASFDLFELGGGTSAMVVGAEHRKEDYADIYDALSASDQVSGSSGNSAGGNRDVSAGYFEVLLPFAKTFEVNLAGRYDKYSDYGSDFSPKISAAWRPLESVALRASYSEGFKAPTLASVTQRTAFSAASTTDRATCIMMTAAPCVSAVQVNTYSIANPNLSSENSKNYGAGIVWDTTEWLNVSLDYYNIEITNALSSVGLATIIGCLRGTVVVCPSGISQFPLGTEVPDASLGLGASFENNNVNGGVINAQTGAVNLGTVKTNGYDFQARTNFDLGWGVLRNQLTVSYVNEYSTNGNPNAVGYYGTPKFRAGLTNVLSIGDININWNLSHIDSQESGLIPSQTINNLQLSYNAPWNATVSLGVNNVADKAPADATYSGTNYDSYMYEPWGRVPYFRYTQRF